jgi:hypothetical protein
MPGLNTSLKHPVENSCYVCYMLLKQEACRKYLYIGKLTTAAVSSFLLWFHPRLSMWRLGCFTRLVCRKLFVTVICLAYIYASSGEASTSFAFALWLDQQTGCDIEQIGRDWECLCYWIQSPLAVYVNLIYHAAAMKIFAQYVYSALLPSD